MLVVFIFVWLAARSVNLLALHADMAVTLGVNVASLKKSLFVGGALLTASAVTSAGNIAFVGLIVPHACRMIWGPDHRFLFPSALLTGGFFLVLADTLSRTVLASTPVTRWSGNFLIGVPFSFSSYTGADGYDDDSR